MSGHTVWKFALPKEATVEESEKQTEPDAEEQKPQSEEVLAVHVFEESKAKPEEKAAKLAVEEPKGEQIAAVPEEPKEEAPEAENAAPAVEETPKAAGVEKAHEVEQHAAPAISETPEAVMGSKPELVGEAPKIEETASEPAEEVEEKKQGWTLVGKDHFSALQARSVLLLFVKAVIQQMNEGVGVDDQKYFTYDRLGAEIRTPEGEQRLSEALTKLSMTMQDWAMDQEQRLTLNEVAHPIVDKRNTLAAMKRHIVGNGVSDDTQKVLEKAATIAAQAL
ncbi:hypothetical protein FN846DRAFT_935367 [Sphaerosporella brunnea]|uniref:Uncharacterized protein n=1 Tax=Sphaerosporella brunnea TaxID=1250544 RepID=A0A5J5F4Y6_9PEZI|nr:hypothetical protein FN846DRAFT_935367 [Sphaerosporella brunnea]